VLSQPLANLSGFSAFHSAQALLTLHFWLKNQTVLGTIFIRMHFVTVPYTSVGIDGRLTQSDEKIRQ
jgi:hypothetical protein